MTSAAPACIESFSLLALAAARRISASASDVLAALGQGCASTAWVVVQNMTHNLMLVHWPDEAQQDV
jgi:hypothetical protein